MPIDATVLRTACQRQVKLLEKDLLDNAAREPDRHVALRAEWQAGRDAERVGEAFETWREEQITQAAVHWVLGCVFVRFLEDNGLVGDPWLAGPGLGLATARSRENEYYGQHPTHHERHWLETAFAGVVSLRGGTGLFDPAHNPLYRWPLTPEAARQLLAFWRAADPETGSLVRDFTDPDWDTRFLGDLYQDLSESARRKYALLQTPIFVEEFILDRTLEPAIAALPLEQVTLIDPTCGSGHFLLGAFARLFARWRRARPEEPPASLAQRTLDQVAGVDLNPFAVAISRFRLLLAALRATGAARLTDAPAFRFRLAIGDSLLHGLRQYELDLPSGAESRYLRHAFANEDLHAADEVLWARYAVVVGNPPYITVKDRALNRAYRERFSTCVGKYALSVPFIERFWQLAIADASGGVAGWVGMINANSFMKREFGKKIIESFFPEVDLTHVINTDGAYIPGHGIPTVILVGRGRPPQSGRVRIVMSIRGEPSTPENPASGLVWTEILALTDSAAGSAGTFVSIADIAREQLAHHPWSMGGGGAAELKSILDLGGTTKVDPTGRAIGFASFTGMDPAFIAPSAALRRAGVEADMIRGHLTGESIRDWAVEIVESALVPYDQEFRPIPLNLGAPWARWLWPRRVLTRSIKDFAGEAGHEERDEWWTWYRWVRERYVQRLSITYAEIATHNHFALDRGGCVFKQSAPVIKLPAGSTEADHFRLIGALNSALACFWLKQVCQNKGSTVDQAGARQRTAPFEDFYQFNGTKVGMFPLPAVDLGLHAAELDRLSRVRAAQLPASLTARFPMTRVQIDEAREKAAEVRAEMIALQEELDWHAYRAYGLLDDDSCFLPPGVSPPPLARGARAFEMTLARQAEEGGEESTWFVRHRIAPITKIPGEWPAPYADVVARRLEVIAADRNLAILERPEFKRRWNDESWEAQEERAIRGWLLDRIEALHCLQEPRILSTRDLATLLVQDAGFVQMAEIWQGAPGAELEPVVRRLILGEAVPFLAALRYSDTGAVKRGIWEQTWALQRREDRADAAVAGELVRRREESDVAFSERLIRTQRERRKAEVGDIPRPPKYKREDFRESMYWPLRGELDVPKERFTTFLYLGRDGDDAPLVGWAGWTALQQAQALGTLYADRQSREGWPAERLLPILAGVAELLPWILQWHNNYDAQYGMRLGEFYSDWLDQQLLALGRTREDLIAWRPPVAPGRRTGRRRAAPAAE